MFIYRAKVGIKQHKAPVSKPYFILPDGLVRQRIRRSIPYGKGRDYRDYVLRERTCTEQCGNTTPNSTFKHVPMEVKLLETLKLSKPFGDRPWEGSLPKTTGTITNSVHTRMAHYILAAEYTFTQCRIPSYPNCHMYTKGKPMSTKQPKWLRAGGPTTTLTTQPKYSSSALGTHF